MTKASGCGKHRKRAAWPEMMPHRDGGMNKWMHRANLQSIGAGAGKRGATCARSPLKSSLRLSMRQGAGQ